MDGDLIRISAKCPCSFIGAAQARSGRPVVANRLRRPMNLVSFALRRPISLLMIVVAVAA
jgi:hypothetical protein